MSSSRRGSILSALASALLLSGLSAQAPVLADPPPWAPANGEREQDRDRDGRDDRPGDRQRDDRPPVRDERGDERRDERRDEHSDNRWDERRDDRRDDRRDYRDEHPQREVHVYRGYGGDQWPDDYGVVRSGRCDTNAALTVFGAVTGGLIGNRAADPANRGIATVFGAIAGGLIGNAVGGAIDDWDRACIGHSLELAPIGQAVVWTNPESHIAWRMVPVRNVSTRCREFDLQREDGRRDHRRMVACRRDRGDWEFQRGRGTYR